MSQPLVIGGLKRALPRVHFVRHRTPQSLGRAFFGPMGAKPEDIAEWPAMLASIREMGVWAFVETEKKTPVVHWWASARADRLRVAYVLGHEVGHISGRPLRSRRNDWREELRADEYGAAAFLAFREVAKLGRRRATR